MELCCGFTRNHKETSSPVLTIVNFIIIEMWFSHVLYCSIFH